MNKSSERSSKRDRVQASILKIEDEKVKVKFSNGEEIWVENRASGISEDFIGKDAELTLIVIPGNVTTDKFAGVEEIPDKLGIESLDDGKLASKVVAEVTWYDVEARWPEAKSKFGYPLVEMDVGIGKVVIAHENVWPVKEKQPYHEEGSKWKILALKLMLKDIEVV